MSPVLELPLLAVAGLVAGALNVIAGGGSFLTLPLLLFLGMPGAMANGTNRVGVLAQNVSGVWGYHQHGALDWRWALGISVPAVVGAGLGAWAALRIPDFAFTRILSMAMLAITLWTVWRHGRANGRADGRADGRAIGRANGRADDRASDRANERAGHVTPLTAFGFFLVGIYGGFIQAGVGFFVLAMTSAAGLDLVRGNAVKVWSVLLMTILSLAIFAGAGTVDWPRGLALASGNFVGGLLGVRLAILRGHTWLQHVVTGAVLVFAVLLWFS